MKLNETMLSFLEQDCLRRFGSPRGAQIYARTEQCYQELVEQPPDRGSAAVRAHLEERLFPVMAYYKVLREEGLPPEDALAYVREETRQAANAQKDAMKKLAALPCAYTVYRLGAKRHMAAHFPDAGWTTEWVKCNGREIHFNLHRCLYWELTRSHGCPELCRVFCENDEITFAGLLPKIRFARSGTLSGGAACCDFHFLKG